MREGSSSSEKKEEKIPQRMGIWVGRGSMGFIVRGDNHRDEERNLLMKLGLSVREGMFCLMMRKG